MESVNVDFPGPHLKAFCKAYSLVNKQLEIYAVDPDDDEEVDVVADVVRGYDLAGRPYGNAIAGMVRWHLEGAVLEHAAAVIDSLREARREQARKYLRTN